MNFIENWPLAALVSQQLAIAVASFSGGLVLGVTLGWMMRGLTLKGDNRGKNVMVMLVNIIIVVLWTASTINTIFQFNDATTPFFLHVLMGAVMGYLNEGFGTWILRMLGKVPTNSNGTK